MKYWFDTEFIEYPCTIDLISIGIVSETSKELYLVSSEFDASKASPWVVDNVISKLGDAPRTPRPDMKRQILEFVDCKRPEFWAYYADYDWVSLCWLMGTMMDLPGHWPKFCRDLKQWAVDLGNPPLPDQGPGEHNALDDARWNSQVYRFLMHREWEERARSGW